MSTKLSAYNQEAQAVIDSLESNVETGLTSAVAAQRLEEFGPNELKAEAHSTLLQKFIEQFKDFMIIILLIAAAVSFVASHEWHDAVIILLVVVLNAIMGVVQEAKAEEAIDDRPAKLKGVLVGQYEDFIVFTLGYREGDILFQIS